MPCRPDREAVKVTPPAIPARDDRSNQLTVVFSDNHSTGIVAEQRGHGFAGIRRPALILGGLLPQHQQPIDVSNRCRPQDESHAAILPAATTDGDSAAPPAVFRQHHEMRHLRHVRASGPRSWPDPGGCVVPVAQCLPR